MQLFDNPKATLFVFIALAVFAVLHVLSIFLDEELAKILSYVNIGLHICAIFLFMWLNMSIFQTVLVYMMSIFVYTQINFVLYLISKRREAKSQEGGEEA